MINGKLYRSPKWRKYADFVLNRDQNTCLKCSKTSDEVTLQVHHTKYHENKKPWEYPYSCCITLCKGCHAKEHGLIEPSSGWILVSIEDLGDLIGSCERRNCGQSIRYEHTIYYPNWGYMIVGSQCVEYLTMHEQYVSQNVVKALKDINKIIHKVKWSEGHTRRGKRFIEAKHKYNLVRIYGKTNYYSVQVGIKEKGVRWYEWSSFTQLRVKSLNLAKELAIIILTGKTTTQEMKKDVYREIYLNTLNTASKT